MKVIKRWLKLKWNPTSDQTVDVEENDLGQLRNRRAGDGAWTAWKVKNTNEWNEIFLQAVKETPPTEDYTTPNKEQAKDIDALKRWLGNEDNKNLE